MRVPEKHIEEVHEVFVGERLHDFDFSEDELFFGLFLQVDVLDGDPLVGSSVPGNENRARCPANSIRIHKKRNIIYAHVTENIIHKLFSFSYEQHCKTF